MPREKQFDETEAIRRFTEVFWQKGYKACSVGDLVAASGLSRSSLYDTFGDKEQLFVRCLQYYGGHIRENLEAFTKDLPSPMEKIAGALQMPFHTYGQQAENCKGCLVVNTMGELDGTNSEVQQLVMNARTGYEAFLAACIEQGQAQGELITHAEPQALARFLYAAMSGLLVIFKAAPNQAFLEEQVALIMKLLQK